MLYKYIPEVIQWYHQTVIIPPLIPGDTEFQYCNSWRRSESFANDAQILDKLHRIKLGLPSDAGGLNGRVASIPEGGGDADKPYVMKPSSSR
jgi:hypothetical protein